LRASLGHPEAYELKYVEVGNEARKFMFGLVVTLTNIAQDFFEATTYVYRWHDFVTALQAEFPNLRA
jgi:alpha-N-arabinofuranosidase